MKSLIAIVFLLGLGLCFNYSLAQTDSTYNKFLFSPSIGFSNSFQSLGINSITDNLIDYSMSNSISEILSFTYYFHKNWGIGVKLRANHYMSYENRVEQFNLGLQSKFGENYYFNKEFEIEDEFIFSDLTSFFLG